MQTIRRKRWKWEWSSGVLLLFHLAFANVSLAMVRQQVNHALIRQVPPANASITATQSTTFVNPMATSSLALVFFFLSTCPHCQRFAPIVKQYASSHHQKLYAFSLDGGTLPRFPHPLPATRAIRQTFLGQGPVVAPMVFLINVKTLQMIEVAQGEESAAQFSQAVTIASTQLLQAATPTRRIP